MTGITDESGQRYATFEYAADGRAVSTEHAGGVDKYAITYASDGSAEISGPNGETQIRAFKAVHGVKKASSVVENCVGCAPKTNLYTHDANGRYDIVTDAMGATTNYDYNARGLLSQKIESANVSAHKRTTQNDWHAEMPLLLERRTYDSASVLKEKITWAYNTRGQATTTTQFDPATNEVRTTTSTYCEQSQVVAGGCPWVGLLLSVDGPRTDVSDVTTYEYYAADHPSCATVPTTCAWRKGDLWKVTNPAGQVAETLRYDGAGRVLSTKDSNGVITDLDYDPRGRLTHRTTRASN